MKIFKFGKNFLIFFLFSLFFSFLFFFFYLSSFSSSSRESFFSRMAAAGRLQEASPTPLPMASLPP
jgi:hypothetical protein